MARLNIESGEMKMGFCEMMELLQKRESGKIIFCNMGNFYIAIGKDAVLLNNLLRLNVSCIKPEMCRVGFPINSLEKYTDLIIQKRYSYAIYYFEQKTEELQIIEDYEGKYKNNLEDNNINCYICSKSIKQYKKPDKYIKALSKLYENEEQKDIKQNKKIYAKNKEEINNEVDKNSD